MVIKKKVCMLGAVAVGKTCLVRRFVSGFFDETYLSTIGVKIDQKRLQVGGKDVDLIILDIAGGIGESQGNPAYLRGLSGYLIVGDGTRPPTCEAAFDLIKYVSDLVGHKPNILLLNKCDLQPDWRVTMEQEHRFAAQVGRVLKTSAKTGCEVDEALMCLSQVMLAEDAPCDQH